MGAFIGMAAPLTLSLQCALFYLALFTSWSEEPCLPLLSRGNAALLIDAVPVEFVLFALRGVAAPKPVAQARVTRSESTSSQRAART